MSTSGDLSIYGYDAWRMLERALRQAGVKSEQFSSEMIDISFDIFNMMLLELPNLGMQLWAYENILLGVYPNQNRIPCPIGTSVITAIEQRTLTRPQPLMTFAAGGGNAAFAFDDDFSTSCDNTGAVGQIIGALFNAPTPITQVGILFKRAGTYAIMVEYSIDAGVTWNAIEAVNPVIPVPGQWYWFQIAATGDIMQPVANANGWRIRSLNAQPVEVIELYFGNNPSDIPLGPWNVNDWDAQVNKNQAGQIWNWYQDRTLQTPVLYVWQTPNQQARYTTLLARRRRYMQNLTSMQQALDVSPRWYEAITCSMARRLCKELPEADLKRFPMLESEENKAMMLAIGEERDPAPSRYNPGLDAYNF